MCGAGKRFGDWGLGFGLVWGLGFMVGYGFRFVFSGLGLVWGLGFRVGGGFLKMGSSKGRYADSYEGCCKG